VSTGTDGWPSHRRQFGTAFGWPSAARCDQHRLVMISLVYSSGLRAICRPTSREPRERPHLYDTRSAPSLLALIFMLLRSPVGVVLLQMTGNGVSVPCRSSLVSTCCQTTHPHGLSNSVILASPLALCRRDRDRRGDRVARSSRGSRSCSSIVRLRFDAPLISHIASYDFAAAASAFDRTAALGQ